jgi:hypothetical protein
MSIDLRPHTSTLAELSLWYVQDIMKVRRGLPIADMCEKVIVFAPTQDTQAKFDKLLASATDLPEGIKAEIMNLNKELVREATHKAQNTVVSTGPMVVTPATNKKKRIASTTDDADSSDGGKKPKATITIQFRKSYQQEYNAATKDKASTVQGVCLLVEAMADMDDAHAKKIKAFDDAGMRRWMARARTVVACVRACANGDPETFVNHNKEYNLSRFAGCNRPDCPSKKENK